MRNLFLVLGWMSLATGIVGIFLPILPTTPFVLLASYFFSKGSPKWHAWLRSRPRMGKMIKDWEERGAIRLRAKIFATLIIIPLFSYTLIFVQVNAAIKAIVGLIGVCSLSFIWTRPS